MKLKEIKKIDSDIYDKCMEDPITRDFVSSFDSKENYLNIGCGIVILKDDKIVSGASSYTRYKEGIIWLLSHAQHLFSCVWRRVCIQAGMHKT